MEDGFSLKDSAVGIIGLGLMGGSLAMQLKGKCARLIGFDSHLPTLEIALSRGIIDQAESFLGVKVDLLILATPVLTIINILQKLPAIISTPCIILDLGSTKVEIVKAMSALPPNFDPIGGHPICGKERPGLENADETLYQNAPFVITPLERTTHRARSACQQLISSLGAIFIELTAEEHDHILASTSHLPFMISSALAHSTPADYASLTGPGFRSTSRLAGTPSAMMMDIMKSNRLNILKSMAEFTSSLHKLTSALENESYTELESLLDECRNSRQILIAET